MQEGGTLQAQRWWSVSCYLWVVGWLFDDFRCHPERGAHEGISFYLGIRQLACHSKISQLHLSVFREQNIGSCKRKSKCLSVSFAVLFRPLSFWECFRPPLSEIMCSTRTGNKAMLLSRPLTPTPACCRDSENHTDSPRRRKAQLSSAARSYPPEVFNGIKTKCFLTFNVSMNFLLWMQIIKSFQYFS